MGQTVLIDHSTPDMAYFFSFLKKNFFLSEDTNRDSEALCILLDRDD
jgi:hypothetical protein